MTSERKEQERLRKLRDAQIAARNPGVSKIPKYDWSKHAARPKPKQKPFLIDLFDILPGRWKGALLGLVFGGFIAAFLLIILPGELSVLALLPLLVCGIVGLVLGKLLQDNTRV